MSTNRHEVYFRNDVFALHNRARYTGLLSDAVVTDSDLTQFLAKVFDWGRTQNASNTDVSDLRFDAEAKARIRQLSQA